MSIIEKAITKLDLNKISATALSTFPTDQLLADSPALDLSKSEITSLPERVVFAALPAALAATQPPVIKAAGDDPPQTKKVDIDLEQLCQLGMVSPHTERSNISEEFRRIKRPLLDKIFNNDSKAVAHNNLIMVSSSLPGEGKTFCAVNLAISIALELDHTVLLVDADVARPAVSRYLTITEDREEYQQGLMDILLDKNLDLSDVMLRTNIDKLTLLRSGRNHKHATELLASHSMNRLLDEISARYPDRVIIFDTPPLLLSTESRVLATQMGHIVLVIEAEATTQNAVRDLLSQFKSTDNISLIYNKAPKFEGASYYGDYYG